MNSARRRWRAIAGPVRMIARRASVAVPLVTVASFCVSASTSDRVLPDSYGDRPLTNAGTAGTAPPETRSRPSRHALCCIADSAARPTLIRVRSIRRSSPETSPPRVVRGLRQVPSGLGLVRALRGRRPSSARSPQGDTGGAGRARRPGHAPCLGCVRGRRPLAFLLVGSRAGPSTDMKEPIPVPIQEKNR